MKKATIWILGIVVVILLAPAIGRQLNQSQIEREKWECEKWNQEAKELVNYYVTNWQIEQCEAVGIPLTGVPTYEEL